VILVLLIIALAGLYGIAVIYAANRFSDSNIPALEIQQERESFSIIIPFRNEAENLPKLLQSLEHIQYDFENYEIIFCNDHSTDSSCNIIQTWLAIFQGNAYLIQSASHGKKAALAAGINTAKHIWILTTDADCTLSPQWLHAFNFDLAKNDWLCLTGLVYYQNNRTFIQYYQSYENAALVALSGLAITHGKTLSANGANFCFHRQTFLEMGGYKEHQHIASGDDEFTLHAFAQQHPHKIGFMRHREGMVHTNPQASIAEFISQRVRWASKSRWVRNSNVIWMQVATVLFLLALISTAIIGSTNQGIGLLACMPLLLKCAADVYFLHKIAPTFSYTFSLGYAVAISLAQCLLIPIIALLSLRGNYTWKGRTSHFGKP
jgi:glycosyltransferase involved in cell wall biosynthesis